MPLDAAARETLLGVTTATITTILLKKGLRNLWMRGTLPLREGQGRVVGPAFTLRFRHHQDSIAGYSLSFLRRSKMRESATTHPSGWAMRGLMSSSMISR